MSLLKNSMVYLVGPIDNAIDAGIAWRQNITPKLKQMGVGVLDPTNKPNFGTPEDHNFRNKIQALKNKGDYEAVRKEMKSIVGFDLRMVDAATFIIAKIDPDIHMAGSYFELCYSVIQRKPIFIFCEQGISRIPNWIYGIIPYQCFYDSVDTIIGHIRCLNDGIIKMDHHWKLFDFTKVFENE